MRNSEKIAATNFAASTPFPLAEYTSKAAGDFDPALLDEFLKSHLEVSRREFCSFLGVAESTLSGWLKGERIPAMVQLVIELILDFEIHGEQIQRLARALDAAEDDARLVKDGETYCVVQFAPAVAEHDLPIGTIVARGIPDEASGRLLLSHQNLRRVLTQATQFVSESPSAKQPQNTGSYEVWCETMSNIRAALDLDSLASDEGVKK